MRRKARFSHLIGLTLVAMLCQAGMATQPTDMAQVMPADTLIYIGWSQCLEQDSPELRLVRQLIEGLAQKDDDEAAVGAALLSALVPLETGSGGIGLFGVTIKDEQPDVELALVADAGSDNYKLVDAVEKLLTVAGADDEIEPHVINGVRLQSVQLPDTPLRLFWGLHSNYFLVTLGETAAGKVIATVNGDAATLADSAEYKFDYNKVEAEPDRPHFCFYVDVQRAIAEAKKVATALTGPLPPIVDQVIEELGLSSMRSKYLYISERDGQPWMVGFAHVDGPLRGWLTLWQQEPVTDDDLRIVPQDAYWMQVNNLDLSKLWQEVHRIVGRLAPDAAPMMDGALAAGQALLGFSITDDLLPVFGDTWAFFDAPSHGGILMSGTVLVADVKDAETLQAILARTIDILATQLEGEGVSLRLQQTQRGGQTIHYVMIGGVPAPVAPAWGFVNGRWVFGLYPQTVATTMRQVDPRTAGASILDNPDFQAGRACVAHRPLGIAYYDSKYFARMFYPFMTALNTAGMSMLAEYGVELDLDVFPPLPEQVDKVTNYVGTSSVDTDGILYLNIGSGAPLAMVAGGAALGAFLAGDALSQARGQAKRAVSLANLRGTGQGCYIYANDHMGKFPDSLEQLIAEGLATPMQFQSPHAPSETIAYIYIAGQTDDSDPRNVLAYERIHDDEGTNVLFVNGHVEFMKLPSFKRVLRETYRRLGREDEIPPELRP